MINVVIIGSGLIGKSHAKYCIEHPNIRFVGFVVRDVIKHKFLEQDFKCNVFASLDEAYSKFNLDAVIIATPNNLHHEHWLQCLVRGLPALIEKPVFMSSQAALSVPEQFKTKSTYQRYMVGHHRLYGSNLRAAKKIIQTDQLGNVKLFNGLTAWYKPEHYFEAGDWRTSTEAGGGVIFINLIHEIATIQYLLGDIREVFAYSTKPARKFNVHDTVTVVFTLDSGAVGTLAITDCSPSDRSWEYNSGENLAYPQYQQDCLYICGDNASLSLPSNTLMYHPESKDWWTPLEFVKSETKQEDPLREQLNAFYKLVCGEDTEVVSLLDGVKNLAVVEAINKSLNSGRSQLVDRIKL